MTNPFKTRPIPAHGIGIGLKPAHYRDALSPNASHIEAGFNSSANTKDTDGHAADFFEVHAENYMGAGGPPHAWLTAIREKYALSVHGVCLSIGGADPIDRDHLNRLKSVVERYQPALVSEHLAWCRHEGLFYNDLIAAPLSSDLLRSCIDHVDEVQNALGRQILIENPSQYLTLPRDMSEPEFLNQLAEKSGCGLLLDINNVAVSAHNLNYDPEDYLASINADKVGQIHLAGHADDPNSRLKIDDHGSPVRAEVGALYRSFIAAAGARPTLIEWDTDTPALSVMQSEAARAADWMASALADHAPAMPLAQDASHA